MVCAPSSRKVAVALSLLLGIGYCSATIHTVSNLTPTPGQFGDIQSAINAASTNDTILVHGSQTAYTQISIDRQLVVIGSGFAPAAGLPTKIDYQGTSCTTFGDPHTIIITPAATGTQVIGFDLSENIYVQAGCDSVTISRCLFRLSYCIGGVEFLGGSTGSVVNENYFQMTPLGGGGFAHNNLLIANNVFLVGVGNGGGPTGISGFPSSGSNKIITNNVFYALDPNYTTGSGVASCEITNNIFCRVEPTFNNCNASNNINYNTVATDPWNANGNVDGGDNILNTSPQFVHQGDIDLGTFDYSTTFFGLSASSPCLSMGPNDPEMGVEGGDLFSYRHANASQLPYISSVNLPVNTIPNNGVLQLEVTSKTHP